MIGLLSIVSAFETDLRAERQADGIASAKKRGVKFGGNIRTANYFLFFNRCLYAAGFIYFPLLSFVPKSSSFIIVFIFG